MPIDWTTNSIDPTSAPKPRGASSNTPRDTVTAYDVAVRLTAKISGPERQCGPVEQHALGDGDGSS